MIFFFCESGMKNPSDKPLKDSDKKPDHAVTSTLMFSEHFRVTIAVAMSSLLCIGLFGGGGYLIDQQMGTYPGFMIAGVLISFPFSQLLIYRWVHKSYTPSLVNKSRSDGRHS